MMMMRDLMAFFPSLCRSLPPVPPAAGQADFPFTTYMLGTQREVRILQHRLKGK